MSFFEDNKEKINSILASIKEAAESEDQEMLISTMQSIPESFWKDRECLMMIMDQFLSWIKFEFSVYPIGFIPESFWEDDDCVWTYVATLCDFYDEERIDYNLTELVSKSVLTNKKILKLLLYHNYEETISYLPSELQTDTDVIFAALEGMEHRIESREDNYNSMVRPLDKEECVNDFLSRLPKELSCDKDFVIRLLDFDSVSDGLEPLYNWIDDKLWSNKEFVLKIVELDEEFPIMKISKELLSDKDFMFSLYQLYDLYELGREYLDEGDDRGVMCVRYAAEMGDPTAQYQLAEWYRYGDKVEKNPEEAEKLFRAAEIASK